VHISVFFLHKGRFCTVSLLCILSLGYCESVFQYQHIQLPGKTCLRNEFKWLKYRYYVSSRMLNSTQSFNRNWQTVVGHHKPRHVARGGDNLVVVKKSATWEIAVVSRQLAVHTHVALARLQTVYWTDVVEAAACHKVAGRRIRARHYPARPQWNCMYLQNATIRLSATGAINCLERFVSKKRHYVSSKTLNHTN